VNKNAAAVRGNRKLIEGELSVIIAYCSGTR
jgi:hypothetical protein